MLPEGTATRWGVVRGFDKRTLRYVFADALVPWERIHVFERADKSR